MPALTTVNMDIIERERVLELTGEGQRFYDLMRIALRRGDPSYLAQRVISRGGMQASAGITANLLDTQTWYLSWQGKIGY